MRTIRVTETHISDGEGGECFRCAIALALQEATGDDRANVYTSDWWTWIKVDGRHWRPPHEVVDFIRAYDGLDRAEDGRVILPAIRPAVVRPFSFRIPSPKSRQWLEECNLCQELFAAKELNDEGECAECLEAN